MTRLRHPHPRIALHDSQRIPKIIFGDTRGLGKVRNLLSLSVEAVYDILRVVRGVIRCKSFFTGGILLLGLSLLLTTGTRTQRTEESCPTRSLDIHHTPLLPR